MFGIVGGAVVYGFALYGLVKFLLGRKAQPDD
jgi:hypothetical protein